MLSTVKLEQLKPGMRVEYRPIGAAETHSTGVIKDILTTESVSTSQRTIHADLDHPRKLQLTVGFVIENDNTNKESVYGTNSILRIIPAGEIQPPKSEPAKLAVNLEDLMPGTKVEYHPIHTATSTSTGVITKVLTKEEAVARQTVHADAQHPRWLNLTIGVVIENDKTHKEHAYAPSEVIRIIAQ